MHASLRQHPPHASLPFSPRIRTSCHANETRLSLNPSTPHGLTSPVPKTCRSPTQGTAEQPGLGQLFALRGDEKDRTEHDEHGNAPAFAAIAYPCTLHRYPVTECLPNQGPLCYTCHSSSITKTQVRRITNLICIGHLWHGTGIASVTMTQEHRKTWEQHQPTPDRISSFFMGRH